MNGYPTLKKNRAKMGYAVTYAEQEEGRSIKKMKKNRSPSLPLSHY